MAKNITATSIISALVFIVVLIIIFFSACFVFKAQCGIDILSKLSKPTPQAPASVVVSPTDTIKLITTAYKGTLPCADCPGLDTELIFKKINLDSLDGTYVMKETYLERNVDPIITEGTWKSIFTSSKGKPIIVFEINSGSLDSLRYFQQVSETELKMLDKNKNEIVGPDLNLTLKKLSIN